MQPERFGKFWLVDKVAAGGMAEIYKGIGHHLDGRQQALAIKKILPQFSTDEDFISLLVDEAKVMVQLNHPNIVPIMEFGKVEESYYIAMEYVEGTTLKHLFTRARDAKEKIPIEVAVHIIREIGSALAYAHRKTDEKGTPLGIVHRDISPTNILVSFEGEVKLTDFGIAKAANQSHRTQAGVIRGKTGYMSPEQTKSGESLDQRSDIYSLGVIFYELLTGERLFKAESIPEALRMIRKSEIPSLSKSRPEIPPNLEAIVLRSLTADPAARYGKAEDLVDACNEFLTRFGPGGRPLRVTHTDLVNVLRRYFRTEMDAHSQEATDVLKEEADTVVDTVPSRTPLQTRLPQTIAANPLYELSNPEFVAPSTIATSPRTEIQQRTASLNSGPTGSLQEAVSGSVRIAKRFSPITVAAVFAGVGVAVILFLLVRQPARRPVEAKNVKVWVRSEPTNAQILRDGQLLDLRTPTEISLLLGSRSKISVRFPGYEESSQEVLAEVGAPALEFKLRKTFTPPPQAFITILTEPLSARVILDDKEISRRTPTKLPPIELGTLHNLRISAKGHKEVTEQLRPDQAGELTKRYILQPLGPVLPVRPPPRVDTPRPLGQRTPLPRPSKLVIGVTGEDRWAFIYVDDQLVDQYPAVKEGMLAGKHKIRLEDPSKKFRHEAVVVIPPGKTTTCQFNIRLKSGGCKSQ